MQARQTPATHRLFACCAIGFGLAALVWGGVFSYLDVPITVVPPLEGSTIDDARREGDARGVIVEATRSVFHPASRAGEVLDQSIAPGARVRHGRRVTVTLSRGQDLVPVPYLRARPLPLAVASLDLLRLQVHVSNTMHDEWINAGAISWQHPAPGLLVPADSVITVIVSRGPPPHAMRNESAVR